MILFVLIGIAFCGEINYDNYMNYGDYGQYEFVPGNKSFSIRSGIPSSRDVGPMTVPLHEHELLTVWVHENMPTMVDAVIVHAPHSYASALTNPLRLFADSFSMDGSSDARAPSETGAPSGGDASGGGATSSSGRAREEATAKSGGSSKRRDDSGSGAASRRDDAARSSSKRDGAAGSSSKRGDGSVNAPEETGDVIFIGATFPRDLGRSRSASSGAPRQSRGDGVGTSGFGGSPFGIRLDRRVAHGADGRTSLQFDVFKAVQKARGWCCVNYTFPLNFCLLLSVSPLTLPSPFFFDRTPVSCWPWKRSGKWTLQSVSPSLLMLK